MTLRIIILFFMITTVMSCSHRSKRQQDDSSYISYQCDNGFSFYTARISLDNNGEITLIHPKGNFQLTRTPTASGAKYTDSQVTWWIKGDRGFISFHDTPISDQCVIDR